MTEAAPRCLARATRNGPVKTDRREPLGADGGPPALSRFPLTERHHGTSTYNVRTSSPEVMDPGLVPLANHGSIWFDLQREEKAAGCCQHPAA